ncbi:hypothetical protein MMC17_008879 [Xylographa soralifera]|nr:hypothetical protein [Xylographa soralifera]
MDSKPRNTQLSHSLPQPPLIFDATPGSLVADARRLVADAASIVNTISKIDPEEAGFDNVIRPFLTHENLALRESLVIRFYRSTSPRKDLRDASDEASKVLTDGEIDLFMREDFYRVVDAVYRKSEALDPEYQYFLLKLHQDFERNGLGIVSKSDRQRFREVRKRTADLERECLKNLNGQTEGLWFTRKELKGLPDHFFDDRQSQSTASVADGSREDDTEAGEKLWVRYKDPDIIPIMKFATNSASRRRMFMGNESRCSQNRSLYSEIFALRDEAARLLGYPNHAAYRTHYKMVQTPAAVQKSLLDVREQLHEQRDRELAALLELKKLDLKESGNVVANDEKLYLWDRVFYDRLLKEKHYSFDQPALAEYFPFDRTLSGMIRIYEDIFHLRFITLGTGPNMVLHDSVTMFSVWDTNDNDSFLGYFYVDPYPRDGKYTHAGHYRLQPGFTAPTGQRYCPSSWLNINFPYPTSTMPSLLKHEELRRLFHEIGHAIHNLVSKTKCARFHGTSVDRDFVEAPAMLFEKFLWKPRHVKELSYHYSYLSPEYLESWKASKSSQEGLIQPPAQLSDQLIKQLVKTEHVNGAINNVWKAWHASFDMAVHTPRSHDDILKMDFQVLFNKLRAEITGLAGPEALGQGFDWGNGFAVFRAIMSGYDAGYYVYLLSQIYSTDLFQSTFGADTMDVEKGMRYRYQLLQPGGSQPEMLTLMNYLGREPNAAAFRKEHGISG